MNTITKHNFEIALIDTDSLKFTNNGEYFTPETRKLLCNELNSIMPKGIVFEDDGYYPIYVVLRSKNYLMLTEDGKIKIRGSALKSSKIEPGIKSFHNRCIRALLSLSDESLVASYTNVCRDLANLSSVAEWSSKKTISEKTVKSIRKNESKILDALKGTHFQLGDKFSFYTTNVGTLKLEEHYNPEEPDHDLKKLLGKIYKAAAVFDNVSPELKARTNYGLSTKAKDFNKLMRKAVLPVKEPKPTPKNVLQNLLDLLATHEVEVKDQYAADEWEKVLENAKTVLLPKEKKPKKKKEEQDGTEPDVLF